MADGTAIEWTDATWNPITGCSIVSPGCTNCYAMKLAGTRLKHTLSRKGLTVDSKAGPVWNGQVRLNEQWLDQPLRWKRPRRIFVCAHGDLFAEQVPLSWIVKVVARCVAGWLLNGHTSQILTKRSAKLRMIFNSASFWENVNIAVADLVRHEYDPLTIDDFGPDNPCPGIWLGISAERQQEADERIPDLLATPAAIRFVSAEPLLGPLNMAWAMSRRALDIAAGFLQRGNFAPGLETLRPLDWIIVGGESGSKARPMHPAWARSIRDQCADAGVPFFMKQWGEWLPDRQSGDAGAYANASVGHRFDDGVVAVRAGKKRAGRRLDGVQHSAFPEVRP